MSPSYYTTIRLADLNGDGKADVCGHGSGGMLCVLSTGAAFGAASFWTPNYRDADRWNAGPRFYSTIHLGHVVYKRERRCGRGGEQALLRMHLLHHRPQGLSLRVEYQG